MLTCANPEPSSPNSPPLFRDSPPAVFRGSLDVAPDRLAYFAALLSADELERADRFRFPIHRTRFIAGRGYLRETLGACLGRNPAALRFQNGRYGKPGIEGIEFNVAHSEIQLLIAVAKEPVGVDIELVRPLPEMDQLAAEVFSSDELRRWSELPPGVRHDSFLALWTRKEALLKAIGLGITEHLKNVSVYFNNNDPIEVPCSLAAQPWRIQTVREDDLTWSVAVASEDFSISERHLA